MAKIVKTGTSDEVELELNVAGGNTTSATDNNDLKFKAYNPATISVSTGELTVVPINLPLMVTLHESSTDGLLSKHGNIRLRRGTDAFIGSISASINPDDVNTTLERLGVDSATDNLFTGDRIDIRQKTVVD